MTILEALLNSVNYPLTESQVIPLTIKRGLDASSEFTTDIANSRLYLLTYADVLRFVITMVNISQGGAVYTTSVKSLISVANGIYSRFGEPLISENSVPPTITIL